MAKIKPESITDPNLEFERQVVLKLIREKIPNVWSGEKYFDSLSALEQKVLLHLVTIGLVQCCVEVVIENKQNDGLRKFRAIYEVRGDTWSVESQNRVDWLDLSIEQAYADSGFNKVNTTTRRRLLQFRLTHEGEKMRRSAMTGYEAAVFYAVDQYLFQFECLRVDVEWFDRVRTTTSNPASVAIAHAAVSVGDTNIHFPQQAAPVVNVNIIAPAGKMSGEAEAKHDGWPTLTETAKRLRLKRPSDVSKLLEKGELKDNGQTGRGRHVDPESILAYCRLNGTAWNDDDQE